MVGELIDAKCAEWLMCSSCSGFQKSPLHEERAILYESHIMPIHCNLDWGSINSGDRETSTFYLHISSTLNLFQLEAEYK